MCREIVENVLSGTKAGFKSILSFKHQIKRKKMDNQKSKSTLSAILLSLTMMVAALGVSTAVAAEKKMVKDPTTGKMVTAPEYGGTFTGVYGYTGWPGRTDSWFGGGAGYLVSGVIEKLGIGNWGIDRDEFNFHPLFMPVSAITGLLAESWETPDDKTFIFHIRQGVHWHDKPPMNGRELTAYDVEYNFHRYFGLGSGFTEPSPHLLTSGEFVSIPYESITATDKWTVVFKLKEVYLPALKDTLTHWGAYINPREVIEEHGDVNDWRNVVGTGPWMLTDLVEGSSYSYTKNPDYWRDDEKYPGNRLPYCDELRMLLMPEEATRLAALRSGKVDHLGFISGYLTSIDQVESLRRINPEIELTSWDYRSDLAFGFNQRVPSPPANDIRVRHALQMALDLETVNNTYFKGYAQWIPQGLLGKDVIGYNNPFEEWPEEVKQYWIYDPEGAEKLLDEAGYPRGADGIRFKVPLMHGEFADLGYTELAATYWREIGIDVEIWLADRATWSGMLREHTLEGLFSGQVAGLDYPPLVPPVWYQSEGWSPTGVQDPVYDAMYAAAAAATTIEEQIRLVKEADMYIIKKHWYIWGPKNPVFNATQPWVIGYNGEGEMGRQDRSAALFARLWIDSELKEAMGY